MAASPAAFATQCRTLGPAAAGARWQAGGTKRAIACRNAKLGTFVSTECAPTLSNSFGARCRRPANFGRSIPLSSGLESQQQQTETEEQGLELDGSDEDKIAQLQVENELLRARVEELESRVVAAPPSLSSGDSAAAEQPLAGVAARRQRPSVLFPDTTDIVWPSPSDAEPFWKRRFPKDGGGDGEHRPVAGSHASNHVPVDGQSLHVVHVTAEMAPLAKVGGLADVVTGLARACIERGHKVEVMLPFYECIPRDQIENLTAIETYLCFHRGGTVSVTNYKGTVSGVPVIFVHPSNHFFRGNRIYGGSYDELEAYLFFSRACLEWMQVTRTQPDIIHAHEWHVGGLPLLYWDIYHHLALRNIRLVLTIHNMEHHGECRSEQLDMCGLDGALYLVPDKAVDDRTIGHNPERLSLLKGGIVYSNAVTTVSPTYVNETLCSGWLSSTLMKHRNKYSGILNGIDTVLWDPAKDPVLPVGFTAQELDGKQICKHYVQRGLSLDLDTPPTDIVNGRERQRLPLVVCITRLVAQKGIHLIRHALWHVEKLGGQFILLGTAPEARVQGEFEQLARQLEDNKRIRVLPTYSEELAHLLFAAADIVLVPSMFEPCGLTQMIGMRYGAIPVVRRTGGLADTVFDVDDQASAHTANGFVFDGISEAALDSALGRALQYYKEKPAWWLDLTSKVMQVDNSWNKSAGQYVALYNSIRVR